MKNLRLTAVVALIVTVWGAALPRSDGSASDSQDTDTTTFRSYQECRKSIDINFQALSSPRQIEMVSGLSIAGMNRLFQRYAHESTFQYLESLKVNQAPKHLRQGNESGTGKQTTS
jgi:hypothetical protein